MKEIINIQIGLCGNKFGSQFWEQLADEHCIDLNGKLTGDIDFHYEKLGVYYNETGHGIQRPRAVLVDLDNDSIDLVRRDFP